MFPLQTVVTSAVAVQTAATVTIATTPTVAVWPEYLGGISDIQYDTSSGYFTFKSTGVFIGTGAWNISCSSQTNFFTDVEISYDSGATWTRGTNSASKDGISNTNNRMVQFNTQQFMKSGEMLRIVRWADKDGAEMVTETDSDSTVSASRLTYCFIISKRLVYRG